MYDIFTYCFLVIYLKFTRGVERFSDHPSYCKGSELPASHLYCWVKREGNVNKQEIKRKSYLVIQKCLFWNNPRPRSEMLIIFLFFVLIFMLTFQVRLVWVMMLSWNFYLTYLIVVWLKYIKLKKCTYFGKSTHVTPTFFVRVNYLCTRIVSYG